MYYDISSGPSNLLSRLVRRLVGIAMLLTAMTAHAEKTISYYTENAGERIDRVLACRDGAEDPNSLGCRNARSANELDLELARRFESQIAFETWKGGPDAKAKDEVVADALRAYRLRILNAACLNMNDSVEPSTPTGKAILKTALDEKLIESQPGQKGKYRTTQRGEEFLKVQLHTAKSGYFCPVDIQYGPKQEVLEFLDWTSQYKGKTNKIGDQIKTVRVSKVSVDLVNTGASVWFARKVYPSALPLKGKIVARFVSFEFANRKGLFSAGGIAEVDGKSVAEISPEKLLEGFK